MRRMKASSCPGRLSTIDSGKKKEVTLTSPGNGKRKHRGSTSLAAVEPQDDSQERERMGRREGWRVDRKRDTAFHCAPSDWKENKLKR